jgi:hypothetical protein
MISTLKIPCDGGCRCGRVRLQISAPPLLTMACHCRGCQLMSSSAFSLSAAIPTPGFVISKGEPVIGGLHGAESHHFFCGHCKSWMFTKVEGLDMFVNLRPTMLDEPRWFVPFIETWTSEKLPWATTPAVHHFEKVPPFEQYAELTEAYAEHVKKNRVEGLTPPSR